MQQTSFVRVQGVPHTTMNFANDDILSSLGNVGRLLENCRAHASFALARFVRNVKERQAHQRICNSMMIHFPIELSLIPQLRLSTVTTRTIQRNLANAAKSCMHQCSSSKRNLPFSLFSHDTFRQPIPFILLPTTSPPEAPSTASMHKNDVVNLPPKITH